MWGVYSGLRLPRRVSAIWVASRPSVLPLASTTSQLRSRESGVATYVFIAKGPPEAAGRKSVAAGVMPATGGYIVPRSQSQPNPHRRSAVTGWGTGEPFGGRESGLRGGESTGLPRW